VIDRTELLLILSASDREQLDAPATLLDRGPVRPILDGDSIVAITTTTTGDSALSAMTLPTASA
jgi:hypothetical protein